MLFFQTSDTIQRLKNILITNHRILDHQIISPQSQKGSNKTQRLKSKTINDHQIILPQRR